MQVRKQIKFFYYVRGFLLKNLPAGNSSAKIKDLEKKLSADQLQLAKDRIEYYNKLSQNKTLQNETTVEDLRHPQTPKSYYFDSYEYARFFDKNLPIDYVFGDVTEIPPTPSIVKSRPVSDDNHNSILLNLDKARHFVFIENDKPFSEKKNMLIGRGVVYQEHRLRFFEKYFHHPLCDLGQVNKNENEEWYKPKISIEKHLDYKFVLSLQGNDVATNLKWVMSSNSIAVMPKPTMETWFMEGKLIGGKHYIEIADDYSDLEEQLNFYISNPDKCLEIIKNANEHCAQFFDRDLEDYISLKVLEKYFDLTSAQLMPVFDENFGEKKSILLLEEFLPKFDQDSGSNRFNEIVKILLAENYNVILAIKNLNPDADQKYYHHFKQMGVYFVQNFSGKKQNTDVENQLKSIQEKIDYAWIFRPEGFDYWNAILEKLNYNTPIIYDMVDLHYLRFARENSYFKKKAKVLRKEQKIVEMERDALIKSDAIAAISDSEKTMVEGQKIDSQKVFVVSNIHQVRKDLPAVPFSARNGIMFIGGFHHKPNVDAVLYLRNEIMPLVWEKKPDIKVHIIGGDLPPEIKALNEERFEILGYQKDVNDWFENSKIFVAPLRYGAGVKGKIGQALEFKLPVVSTPIGVEGMKLTAGTQALVAEIDNPQKFAENILELYQNEALWLKLHQNSESGLEIFSVKTQTENIRKMISFLDSKSAEKKVNPEV